MYYFVSIYPHHGVETLHNVVAYGIHADFSLGPKVFQEIHDVLYEFEVGILGMR